MYRWILEGEKKVMRLKKISEELMPETFKLGKIHKPTHSRNWANPRQDKLKEIYGMHTITKLLKTNEKGKILKMNIEKQHIAYKGKTTGRTVDFSSETTRPEEVTHFWRAERKELSTRNSISSENMRQEWGAGMKTLTDKDN